MSDAALTKMPEHMSLFMIRRVSDGAYSKGGSFPFRTYDSPKVWTSKKAVVQHIAMLRRYKESYGRNYRINLDDMRIVEMRYEAGGELTYDINWSTTG
jgi:hypothetical protein